MNNNRENQTKGSTGPGKIFNRIVSSRLPTKYGEFCICVYQAVDEVLDHVAISKGELKDQEHVLVRVHSECLTGDALGSLRCDCGDQLDAALKQIAEVGRGVVIYLRGHEGRGIGLANKIRAYQLQDQGRDTVEANLDLGLPVDTRDYEAAVQILSDLGVKSIRLMTNNPSKLNTLVNNGVDVTARVPVRTAYTAYNSNYLRTKMEKLGHMLFME